MKGNYSIILIILFIFSCNSEHYKKPEDAAVVVQAVAHLTDVTVHDIFSPPVASRNYVYPCLALYETLAYYDPSFTSMADILRDFSSIPDPVDSIDPYLAGIEAFYRVGGRLVNSNYLLEEEKSKLYEKYFEGMPGWLRQNSIAYGDKVAAHILQYATEDGYDRTRAMSRYNPGEERNGFWIPTPPDYMDAIEPHWNKIRPFVLDSANQFIPAPPTDFSTDVGSTFYTEAMQVYQAVNDLDIERESIANFWDCNPYVTSHIGHVMIGNKKISPGGHWMGITSIVSLQDQQSAIQSAYTHLVVSIALFDGFISCWDEKYRSNLIRPETYINTFIDADWLPELETPPFPEHTSGHSVISRAAAEVLTILLGDSYAYTDTVEVKYGLEQRHYTSFLQASDEAAISRLYGGIHFMPAIEEGVQQGRQVGRYVANNLNLQLIRNNP